MIYNSDQAGTLGCMAVFIILGSDKTTVSVATGNVEYHPVYMSIGNILNSTRRAHRNGVILLAFLAIPKCKPAYIYYISLFTTYNYSPADRKYDNDVSFRRYKQQLFHTSLAAILESLKPGMSTPVVLQCPDGHFRRCIYEFGAFIADYPEQVLLTGIVQGWCPMYVALAFCSYHHITDIGCFSGTAPSSNLDQAEVRRSKEHTAFLKREFDNDPIFLWDNYGLNVHVVVCVLSPSCLPYYSVLTPDNIATAVHRGLSSC